MRIVLLLLILCGGAHAQPAPAPPAPPANFTPPADELLEEAKQALASNELGAFAAKMESRLKRLLTDPARADVEQVLHLCTLREFARYFGRVEITTVGQRDTLRFLLSSPRLLRTLMMIISDADPPDRVLEMLRSLRGDHRRTLEEFAELTAAMCVVWDAPERFGLDEEVQLDAEEVNRIFDHLLSVGRRRFDEDGAAAQMLVYVVDVELTAQELAWSSRYGARVDVPGMFFSVGYTDANLYERRALYERARDDANRHSYVLPNIIRRGGNCSDAAYCAAQIAKAWGMPATVVRAADAGDGATPAWVAFVVDDNRAAWDVMSARHAGHRDWTGELLDPQTYETIPQSELALVTAEARTPAQERLASLALCKSADLVGDEKAMALLERAISLSPGNRRAWRALARQESEGKLDESDVQRSVELVETHLAGAHPPFALSVRLRALENAGTLDHAAAMTRLRQMFRGRADVLAEVELAAGDRLREERRRPEAVSAYLEALRLGSASPATALRALSRLDDAYRRINDLPRLAALYEQVFSNLPPPKQTRHGHTTPYYGIGARYAAVLEELKQAQAAAMVRVKIANVVIPR